VVTEHTNDTEQSSPDSATQQPNTQEDRLWYAIHTYSGYENKVKSHLEARINSMDMRNKIFRVIVPMEEEVEIKQGQRRTVQRKVFPGYVLVEMVMSDEAWYVVRNTPGVTSFVGSGTRPIPLQDLEAGDERDREAEGQDQLRQRPERARNRWPVHRIYRHRQRYQHGSQQGDSAGLVFRSRDASHSGFPSGRENLT